jgi:flagellar hook-length control protein FliK
LTDILMKGGDNVNFNELLMSSIAVDKTNVSFGTDTAKTGAARRDTSFAQIFSSRLSDSSIRSEGSRSTQIWDTAGNSASKGADEKSTPLYRSYRQVRESCRNTRAGAKTAACRADSEGRISDNDNGPDSGKKEKMTAVSVVQVLAQLLGLDGEKLERLLAENGINPEDLDGLEDISKTAHMLSDALGLDPVREDTLGKLLEIVRDALENGPPSGEMSGGISFDPASHQFRKAQGNTAADKAETMPKAADPAVEDIISGISEKLDRYREMLISDPDTAEGEIKDLMAQMLRKSDEAKQNVTQLDQTEASDTAGEPTGSDAENVRGSERSEKDTAGDSEGHDLQTTDGESEQGLLPKSVQNGVENVQQQFAVISNENTGAADVSRVGAGRQNISAKDIISQIVDKAGTAIAGDKAEMVMELKPESLGRISLKVVTENGIVMAKFVAENRQVQQVLETNLQILKDSLEGQGINVQSLSVSVRQDERQPEGYGQQSGSLKRMGGRRSATGLKTVESAVTGIASSTAERNPYLWESSTINLTA